MSTASIDRLKATVRRTATLVPTTEQRLARCQTPLSKRYLFNALSTNGAAFIMVNNLLCILVGMSREDGSGSSFNLDLVHDGQKYRCYCRTVD